MIMDKILNVYEMVPLSLAAYKNVQLERLFDKPVIA